MKENVHWNQRASPLSLSHSYFLHSNTALRVRYMKMCVLLRICVDMCTHNVHVCVCVCVCGSAFMSSAYMYMCVFNLFAYGC